MQQCKMQYQMVRDEDSAQQLMVTKGMACSFGMHLAPMARNNEEKINQNTAQVLALLQLNCLVAFSLNTNSFPYDVGEDLAGALL